MTRHALLLALFALTGCASSSAPRPAQTATAEPAAEPPAEPPPAVAGGHIYQHGIATYYANSLAGHATASGEPYNPAALTAAHRTLPLGAVVDVARTDGRHVAVRINDRGPVVKRHIIDLSHSAAREIGLLADGIARVQLRVVSLPPPRAKRRRR